jgi:hypothetical protein
VIENFGFLFPPENKSARLQSPTFAAHGARWHLEVDRSIYDRIGVKLCFETRVGQRGKATMAAVTFKILDEKAKCRKMNVARGKSTHSFTFHLKLYSKRNFLCKYFFSGIKLNFLSTDFKID